jgi:uncharacterized membrane protein
MDMEETVVTFPRKGADYVALPSDSSKERVSAHAVQTIAAGAEEIFNLYSRAEAIPVWQDGVISVTPIEGGKHHWIMEDPTSGSQIEFDSEVLIATPGVRHVSRIVSGPFTGTTDTITFEAHPHGRGTVVTWISDFFLPAASLSNALAGLISRSPKQAVIENLRRLKQLMESGQIPSVEGQPAGPRGITGTWKRFLLGENIPPPPGTSDRAQPRDMPQHENTHTAWMLASVAVVAGATAWYGLRTLRSLD